MDALGQVAQWPVDRAGVAVLRFDPPTDDRVPVAAEPIRVTGPTEQSFRWASVTKPATALAALVAVEEGTLSLDQPAGPAGSTVRHLLAHTSGLGLEGDAPVAPPGTRRVYSNTGYTVLAELIADRSGLSFGGYLGQAVLGPLGMTGTTLDPDAAGGSAAAGLVGPLTDLVALGAEWAVPTLVSFETHRDATSVQFPGRAGVLPGFQRFDPCDWGLGVEIRGHKQPHWTGSANSPRTYGHFGRSGAFVWVDPQAGVVCAGFGDRAFGPWSVRAWPALSDSVLSELAAGGQLG
jgi:CubicO group peptidase (beta-lactamase class C family)